MRTEYDVDVIIAVHTKTRPIERAVSSVLENNNARIRVTVVAHNMSKIAILDRLTKFLEYPNLRVLEYSDGVHSPAGPMNYGLHLSHAKYASILGSDDSLEAGAIDAWLHAAELQTGNADMVIAPMRRSQGSWLLSPPVRLRSVLRAKAKPLNAVKDRLVYRSAPLGLIGRRLFADLRLEDQLETGEDQPFCANLWFSPGSIVVFPVGAPGYVENSDQDDRVTYTPRSVAEEFRVFEVLLDDSQSWMQRSDQRLALAVKLIRKNLIDTLHNRLETHWSDDDATELVKVAERIIEAEPRAPHVLSILDARLFETVLSKPVNDHVIRDLLIQRSNLRTVRALVPARLRYVFHSQGPLRTLLASKLLRSKMR